MHFEFPAFLLCVCEHFTYLLIECVDQLTCSCLSQLIVVDGKYVSEEGKRLFYIILRPSGHLAAI
jgi:hypothetical protein